MLIARRRSHAATLIAALQNIQHLSERFRFFYDCRGEDNASRCVQSRFHLRVSAEQIVHFLVVDFNHSNRHRVANLRVLRHLLAERFQRARNHPGLLSVLSFHRKRLARAGLAVGEDAGGESVQDAGDQASHFGEDEALRGKRVEYAVEFVDFVAATLAFASIDGVLGKMDEKGSAIDRSRLEREKGKTRSLWIPACRSRIELRAVHDKIHEWHHVNLGDR